MQQRLAVSCCVNLELFNENNKSLAYNILLKAYITYIRATGRLQGVHLRTLDLCAVAVFPYN
jgi:hypothetical protein